MNKEEQMKLLFYKFKELQDNIVNSLKIKSEYIIIY
jgi:hypothetical protein